MDDTPPHSRDPLFVTDLTELRRLLDLSEPARTSGEIQFTDFPLLASRPYLARIPKGDSEHPLLLQVLPQSEEWTCAPGYDSDPLGEHQSILLGGTLRKYPGRLLIVPTSACAVHCRFCFRRHLPHGPNQTNPGRCNLQHSSASTPQDRWDRILSQVEADTSLREVILSGGDPLMLSDGDLAGLLARLSRVRHVARVRIHTRVPVMLPQRVTDDLVNTLRASIKRNQAVIVVVHVNHPAEIDDAVASAFARFVDAGIPMLSQSVLLRRVNDRFETLAELFQRLVELRVMPYYLHQLDRVAGTAHFEVPESEGLGLVRRLRAVLPGYAVPRYVRETVGETSKRLLA